MSIRIERLHPSFGGTWYVLNTSGNPVTSSQAGSSSSTGGGYGY
jgi:hypothetical protein